MGSTNDRAIDDADERAKLARQVQRLRTQIAALRRRLAAMEEGPLPELPPADDDGNFPALETVRVILARKIMTSRREAGLSRQELALKARVRLDTLLRIESGDGSPGGSAVDKIDRALRNALAKGAATSSGR
jgi:ribosome-binding protein aMBF1 (putative translation factor)